jgi:hypothetical protein
LSRLISPTHRSCGHAEAFGNVLTNVALSGGNWGCGLRSWRGGFFQGGVDQVLEIWEAGTAADGVAVDEEEWGAVYAEAVAFLAVGLYLRFEAVGVQIFGEARDVQVQLGGFGDEVVARERD